MSKSNKFVFTGLLIVSWMIFVGLGIEAGGLITNFIVSLCNPEFIPNLYQKLNLIELYNQSQWTFFSLYSFILVVAIMKAFLFYIVVRLMHQLDMSNPFNSHVSREISRLSYCTFSIGILSIIAHEVTKNWQQHDFAVEKVYQFWEDGQAFILMAAVIYLIALIFKKGVEIQNENDLTV